MNTAPVHTEADDIFSSLTDGELAHDPACHALVEVDHLRLAAVNYAFARMVSRERLALLGAYLSEFVPLTPARVRAFDAMVAGWLPRHDDDLAVTLTDGTAQQATLMASTVRDQHRRVRYLLVRVVTTGPVRLIDFPPRSALVVDRRFAIRLASADFGDAVGSQPDDLLGASLIDLLHPEDLQALTNVAAHLREGRLLEAVIRIRVRCATPVSEWQPWEARVITAKHRTSELIFTNTAPEAAPQSINERAPGAARIMAGGKDRSDETQILWDDLSPREREVLVLVGQGHRVPSIARELFVSAGTVRNHLSAIFKKVGVTSQAALHDVLQS